MEIALGLPTFFLYFQQFRKCSCEQLGGYTIAIITAHAPAQHIWASPCPWPVSKPGKCSQPQEYQDLNFCQHEVATGVALATFEKKKHGECSNIRVACQSIFYINCQILQTGTNCSDAGLLDQVKFRCPTSYTEFS